MKTKLQTLRKLALGLTLIGTGLCASTIANAQKLPFGLTNQQMALIAAASPEIADELAAPFFVPPMEQGMTFWSDSRVNQIAKQLAPFCKRKHVRVQVVADNNVNAFASFGANIYVNTGLIQHLGDDDAALAFVIAHEMGHAELFHVSEYFAKKVVSDWVGRSLTKANQPDLRDLLRQITMASFTRPQETAADEAALRIIAAAGFDPEGAVRGLNALAQLHPGSTTILDTHPAPSERARHLAKRIASNPNSGLVGTTSKEESSSSSNSGRPLNIASSAIGSGWRRLSESEAEAEFKSAQSLIGGQMPPGDKTQMWKSDSFGGALVTVIEVEVPANSQKPTVEQLIQGLQGAEQQVKSVLANQNISYSTFAGPSSFSDNGFTGASVQAIRGSGSAQIYTFTAIGAMRNRPGSMFIISSAGPDIHRTNLNAALTAAIQNLNN